MLPRVLLLSFVFFPWVLGAQKCQCRCTCLAEQVEKALQVPHRQTRQLRHHHQLRQRHRLRGSKSHSEEFIPQILDHPSDLVVRWDQPATLNCRAIGNPTPTIEWYRNGEYVKTNKDDAASQPTLLMDGSLFFLRLSQKKGKSDEGVYNCVAKNHHGTAVSKNASLYVEVLQEGFRLHPSDLVVTTGELLLLECVPPRGHPKPTVSWKKNEVPINQENGHYEVTTGKLLVAHALKSDSGAYVCMATNQAGERTSQAAMVTVLEKPTFSRQPNDASAKLGGTAQFMCGVHGDPTPVVQWHKENGELPLGRYEVNQENVLQINDLRVYDAGRYVCTAHNKVGTTSAKASLTVHVPSAAPQSVRMTTIQGGNGTVIIHWEPPPHDVHNDIIKAYQIWFLGNYSHHGSNKTVDGGTHSLELTDLVAGLKYCVQVAAVSEVGIGVSSKPVCYSVEPTMEKMAKTSDLLSSSYILEVVRQPVFIASLGSALWVMLMVLAVYVCQQQARHSVSQQYALGDGLYRNASDDTMKHRVYSSDSPWLSNTWKSTSGSKNYSSNSSLSSQLLWPEPKENQEYSKSTESFERQSQVPCIQTSVSDGGTNCLYGTLCMDLPKTFYGVPLAPPSTPSLRTLEFAPTGDRRLLTQCSRKPRMESIKFKDGPWETTDLLPSNLIIQGSSDKNSKNELQQMRSAPLTPLSFSAEQHHGSQATSLSSGRKQQIHGKTKKVLKTYSSPKVFRCSTSQKIGGFLPPPPPIPPGFHPPENHITQQECTCICYLEPPMDFASCQQDKDSLTTAGKSVEESPVFPTLPYNCFSAASISVSDDRETVLTPEEVAEYLELSEEAEHQRKQNNNVSAAPRKFSSPDTYGYICGPLVSELLENGAVDDDDASMVETGGHSTNFFRSFYWTPSSSLSEDEASLGGSLLNGWGSISEDNGTSTRCSLVSSSDDSFLVDANFAQALAVVVDSFCYGLGQKEDDKALTDFLTSTSPLDGFLCPDTSMGNSEETQQNPSQKTLPGWEWNTDWVDEMETKYRQQVENWTAVPKMGKGKNTGLGALQLLTASTTQEINEACRSDLIRHPDVSTGAVQPPPTCTQDPSSETFDVPKEGKNLIIEKFIVQREDRESNP